MVRLLTSVTPDKPEFQPFIDLEDKLQRARGVLAAYQGPRLRSWEIQVEGPYLEQWPSQGHHTLYGDLQPSDFNDQNLRTQLHNLHSKLSDNLKSTRHRQSPAHKSFWMPWNPSFNLHFVKWTRHGSAEGLSTGLPSNSLLTNLSLPRSR